MSFVRIFASFTPHKRIVHPLHRIHTNRLLQTSSETRAHEKYAIHTYRILCIRHIIYAYYCCAEIRCVCISSSPRLISYTHIYYIYVYIGEYYIHANDRIYIYIYISMCNRWLNRNGGIPLSRDRDKCATDLPATQTKRPNNRGLHFFMCAYLYIMYIYIIYVYR